MTIKEQLASFPGGFQLGEENSEELLKIFREIAETLICKGYIQTKSGDKSNQIYIDEVEFYYHEEKDGIKDPIMYHRNHDEYTSKSSNKTTSYFSEIGELNLHQSGIDIAFENEWKKFRASVLIRAFRVGLHGDSDNCSTHLYSAIFSGMSIFDGINISWVPDENDRLLAKDSENRVRVKKYNGYCKTEEDCNRKWRFKVRQ